jgi:hypothetical protein
VTLVAERDIDVVDHVRYKNNPQTVTNSTDALGLIARRGVMVTDSAPDDLEIYAHIIAQESGFGVEGYDRGSSRGTLTVYGGIVNEIRQAVGTTSPSGYRKTISSTIGSLTTRRRATRNKTTTSSGRVGGMKIQPYHLLGLALLLAGCGEGGSPVGRATSTRP